jgi:hypothetical protein
LATVTTTILEDDIDGGEAAESIEFGVDGVVYEIDLSNKNAEALRDAFQRWIEAGRRTGGRTRPGGGARSNGSQPRQKSAITVDERHAIQRFAVRAGLTPPAERGRIARSVVEAWEASGRPMN